MSAKVFKVDNISVTVFGTAIDGIVEVDLPRANNRDKKHVTTVEGVVGFTSQIIAGEVTFKITTMSNQYHWLSSIVDDVTTGTVVFSMPGAVYTMYNAIIASVEPDSVKDETPTATVKVLYCKVSTAENGYE